MINININNKPYTVEEYEGYIEAICLFGSRARGDNDSLSDIDIFVLIEDCSEDLYVSIKKSLEMQLGIPSNWISLYRKDTINLMHDKGSYFLWHLKKEGIILYSRKFIIEQLLETLPKYKSIDEDLADYSVICKDIKESIQYGNSTAHFELSVLASLVRNTCIALSYKHGELVFGRIEPVQTAMKIIGANFPFTIKEYKELYKFRIVYTRGDKNIMLQDTSENLIKNWVKYVEFIIDFSIKYQKEEDYL